MSLSDLLAVNIHIFAKIETIMLWWVEGFPVTCMQVRSPILKRSWARRSRGARGRAWGSPPPRGSLPGSTRGLSARLLGWTSPCKGLRIVASWWCRCCSTNVWIKLARVLLRNEVHCRLARVMSGFEVHRDIAVAVPKSACLFNLLSDLRSKYSKCHSIQIILSIVIFTNSFIIILFTAGSAHSSKRGWRNSSWFPEEPGDTNSVIVLDQLLPL